MHTLNLFTSPTQTHPMPKCIPILCFLCYLQMPMFTLTSTPISSHHHVRTHVHSYAHVFTLPVSLSILLPCHSHLTLLFMLIPSIYTAPIITSFPCQFHFQLCPVSTTPTHPPPILMTFILPLFILGQCYAYAISILFLCPCNLPTHVCSHLMLMPRSMHPYHVIYPHLQPSHTRIHNRVHIYLMLIPSLCPCYIHACLCHDYSFPTSMSTPMFISSHCPCHIHVDPFSFPHHACAYANICLLPIPMLISTSIYSLCPFPL